MFQVPFPVEIIHDVSLLSIHTLLVEIRSRSLGDILGFLGVSISSELLGKISEHAKKEKFFVFYPENSSIFEIVCFFPSEDTLQDDRSEIFQKFSKNVAYLPDGNIDDAFENFVLSTYEFSLYKTKKDTIKRIFIVQEYEHHKEILSCKISLLEAILTARNLVNMPPQDLNPESFASFIQSRRWKNFDVEVFGDSGLRELGCNLIRAVGQGSVRESFMIILKPKKNRGGEKYGLVGKGVTFDSGGIQIKPDTAMLDMKSDMAGAAGVLGVAMYLDTLEELPVDIFIGLGLVENMTGSSAFKPKDVYRAYNGTSVEIHHTDAEGRLVLADVMSYVEKNFHVNHIVTMATLTGACLHALGNDIAGIMGDDEEFISLMLNNTSFYEPVWRLPLPQKLKKSFVSDVADIKNMTDGEYMGSSAGAVFLSYFQGSASFTHLDIAGPAYRSKSWGYMLSGGTGWGVKKLSEVFKSYIH